MATSRNRIIPRGNQQISKPALYAAIMAAGFCGACFRYGCLQLPLPHVNGFPLTTLLINVVGSFLIFLVFQHAGRRLHLTPQVITIINTGFLGAFTTLSAVCTDTLTLLGNGQYGMVVLYVGLTATLSFAAVLLADKACDGLAIARMYRLRRKRARHHARRERKEGRR